MQQEHTAPRNESAARLVCYALHDYAPKLVPGRAQRRWMDAFAGQQAYGCLPMSIANALGWDVLCPVPIDIEWTGGKGIEDLTIRALKPLPGGGPVRYFCASHFSFGIVTMHVDYIFRTEPGWNILATGPFNSPKENAYPLSGIVESDSLAYPFTMNWQVLRPGRVHFEEDEPFCSVIPVRVEPIADFRLETRRISDNPDLERDYRAMRASREPT